jgi:hypothetical protein
MDKNVSRAVGTAVVAAIVVNTAVGLTKLAIEKTNDQPRKEQRDK